MEDKDYEAPLKCEFKRTDRGFPLVEFKDSYDNNCSLQASSVAHFEKPGTSAVFLGRDDATRMHLSYGQVGTLIELLTKWQMTGTWED